METLKNQFIALSSQIISDNKALAKEKIGFLEMFQKKVVGAHKKKIDEHFHTLAELDHRYAGFLRPQGSINELLMLNAQIQILTLSRSMATGALKNYEASITGFEGQLQFRLSVTLAVIALVVSIVSVGA